MNRYYSGDLLKFSNLDILEEIQKALVSATMTLPPRRSVHTNHNGLQAVEWWKQGELQKIKDYCLQDVKVTKEVYEYGLKYGRLLMRIGFGSEGNPVQFKYSLNGN